MDSDIYCKYFQFVFSLCRLKYLGFFILLNALLSFTSLKIHIILQKALLPFFPPSSEQIMGLTLYYISNDEL